MHAARAQPGEMPLADQQPGRRELLLLRERASQRIALLPGARAHCISVGRSAAQQRGCMNILSGVDDPSLATEAGVDEKPAIDGTLKPIIRYRGAARHYVRTR